MPASTVADRSPEVERMAQHWPLISALLGGTLHMRRAGKTYLPQLALEEDDDWQARCDSTTLLPAFKRTVQTLAAKPFSKPLTYGDDVPPAIKKLCEANCDLQNRDLHTFASDAMMKTLAYGIAALWTDFQAVDPPGEGAPARSVADEAELGLRPYLILIKAEQFVGGRIDLTGAAPRLTMFRFKECITVDDGDYGSKEIEQVRVLIATGSKITWETHRRAEAVANSTTAGDWVLFKSGAYANVDEIPISLCYADRVGIMESRPPLDDLAHMNVEHWQSSSDQFAILHIARVPILVAKGVDDKKFKIAVGSKSFVRLPANASLEYVEHDGKSIQAGADSLKDLEERMRQAGAELLQPTPGRVTAFQVASENSVGMSLLQSISLGIEDALDQSLQFMADFMKLGEGGHVQLYHDYLAGGLTEASMADVLKANTNRIVSNQTTFQELQRRGTINGDLVWADEQDRIDEEGPPDGTLGGFVDNDGLPIAVPAGTPSPPGAKPVPQPPTPNPPAKKAAPKV